MTIYGSTCYTVVVKHVRMCSRTVTFCKMQVLVTIQTSAIRFRLVLDQFSITFYEKVLKIICNIRVTSCTMMSELHMAENDIQQITYLLSHSASSFDSETLFQEVPASMGNLTNLVYLTLDKNRIEAVPAKEVPASMGNLTNLVYLTLDKNRIEAVPAKIAECSKLTILTIRENLIAELPEEISNIASLRVFDIACNRLQNLPGSYRNLNLTALWLSDNQSKALVDLQDDRLADGTVVLVNYLIPQAYPEEDDESEAAYESDSGTEEDAPATNYRESKIMFEHVKLGDGGGGLLRHPTPTPKQLNKMKNQRASWLNAQQEGAAAAGPNRPAPHPPAAEDAESVEEYDESPDERPTSPLLQNGFNMGTSDGVYDNRGGAAPHDGAGERGCVVYVRAEPGSWNALQSPLLHCRATPPVAVAYAKPGRYFYCRRCRNGSTLSQLGTISLLLANLYQISVPVEKIIASIMRFPASLEDLLITGTTTLNNYQCTCGEDNSIDHAISCKLGGFVNYRHDNVRDFIAKELSTVCLDTKAEPHLLNVRGTSLPAGTITADGARLDIRTRGLWSSMDCTYFDVRIFNPRVKSNANQSIQKTYEKHETEKKKAYLQRVLQVEKAVFTPLVMSTSGGLGREFKNTLKQLANRKSKQDCVRYLRLRLSFAMAAPPLLKISDAIGFFCEKKLVQLSVPLDMRCRSCARVFNSSFMRTCSICQVSPSSVLLALSPYFNKIGHNGRTKSSMAYANCNLSTELKMKQFGRVTTKKYCVILNDWDWNIEFCCKTRRKLLQLSFIMSQNLKSKDAIVFTQFAIYQSQSFKITHSAVTSRLDTASLCVSLFPLFSSLQLSLSLSLSLSSLSLSIYLSPILLCLSQSLPIQWQFGLVWFGSLSRPGAMLSCSSCAVVEGTTMTPSASGRVCLLMAMHLRPVVMFSYDECQSSGHFSSIHQVSAVVNFVKRLFQFP
eukprot:sb/3461718/